MRSCGRPSRAGAHWRRRGPSVQTSLRPASPRPGAVLFPSPWNTPPSQLLSLLWRDFSRCENPDLTSSFLPEVEPSSCLLSSSFPLLSFILPGYMEIIHFLLCVWSPLLVFSRGSVRSFPFLMYSWCICGEKWTPCSPARLLSWEVCIDFFIYISCDLLFPPFAHFRFCLFFFF